MSYNFIYEYYQSAAETLLEIERTKGQKYFTLLLSRRCPVVPVTAVFRWKCFVSVKKY